MHGRVMNARADSVPGEVFEELVPAFPALSLVHQNRIQVRWQYAAHRRPGGDWKIRKGRLEFCPDGVAALQG